MEIQEVEEAGVRSPYPISTVAVAVNGSKNSKNAVKWALEKFIPEGRVFFRILHVRPKINMIPTPLGYIQKSEVREDVALAYQNEIAWKTNTMLLPYKKLCAQRQVEAEAVIIEADDVAEAISEEIEKFSIHKLVIGASHRNVFTWTSQANQTTSRISAHAPSFCTVYVVSKGKLLLVRAPTSGASKITRSGSSSSVASRDLSSTSSSTTSDLNATRNFFLPQAPLLIQRYQALAAINHNLSNTSSCPSGIHHSRSTSFSTDEDHQSSSSSMSEALFMDGRISDSSSFQVDNKSQNLDQPLTLDGVTDSSIAGNQFDMSIELEKLRIELKHFEEVCWDVQNEAHDASRQISELTRLHTEEAIKLQDIKSREEKTRELARREKERCEAAEKEAVLLRESAEREAWRRKSAEHYASCEATEKQRLEKALWYGDEQPYKKFTWEEIESATSSFCEALKLGMGANGTVYKGRFHHTVAAVKVLHSNEGHGSKQFKQELEILGRMRHPHLLMLLGACPDRSCLVYEYMENGSLDDRLHCKNDTPAIPWYYRYRIAWEVASALAFLHKSKPEPIIHRDLKPANILLDKNFVSKIGDVGISTLVPTASFSMSSTMYKDTAPVGTLCYIDPEYQRSGLVSPKSDVYALGMVILELLTTKPPMGLTYIVETAVENGTLMDILDAGAGQWPIEETHELALLGLNCAELRRKDRPDLNQQVLPTLERLKGIADKAHEFAQSAPSIPPSHFICPILKEVMDDPCVASDGYTYDRKAIEMWFSTNDKSPMTNLCLPSKNLIPNYSLLSAIQEWKSRTQ